MRRQKGCSPRRSRPNPSPRRSRGSSTCGSGGMTRSPEHGSRQIPRKGSGYDCDNLMGRLATLKAFFDKEQNKFRVVAIAILRHRLTREIITVVSVSGDNYTPEQIADITSHGEKYVGGPNHAEM